jgi:hypothetical protein
MIGVRVRLREVTGAIFITALALAFVIESAVGTELVVLAAINLGVFFLLSRTRSSTVHGFFLGLAGIIGPIMVLIFWRWELWGPLAPFVFFVLPVAPGVAIYWFSWLPFKVRLPVEILILIALLALSSWVWRERFCDRQADRAAELSQQITAWAERSRDAVVRERLSQEARWFQRAGRKLRRRAYWIGLTRGPWDDVGFVYTEDPLLRELGVLEVMEKHERIAQRLHEGRPDEPEDP